MCCMAFGWGESKQPTMALGGLSAPWATLVGDSRTLRCSQCDGLAAASSMQLPKSSIASTTPLK